MVPFSLTPGPLITDFETTSQSTEHTTRIWIRFPIFSFLPLL
jgi:hypothetical protein